jgi:hypothetical protein
MRMLEVTEDGELKEILFRREDVDSGKVYLFVNDDEKQIILWCGKEARTRSKFIGARLASSLRLEHGLSYKMVQIDEAENPDFLKAGVNFTLGRPQVAPPSASGKSESRSAPQVSTLRVQPQPRPPVAVVPNIPSSPRVVQPQTISQRGELDQTRVIERLSQIEVPKGFERELVVIGHDIFAVSVSKTRVFGKEKVEHKIGRVTNPLEDGIFMAEEHTPRVIIENGHVLAVEFLRQASKLEGKGRREKPSSKQEEVSSEEPLESLMEKHLGEIMDIFKGGAKKEESKEEE